MCSVTGATSTPRATSSVTSSAVNGRPALGISALPGSSANDGLVGVDRIVAGQVRVADRATVPAQVPLERLAERQPREPEPVAPEVGGHELGVRSAGQLEPRSDRRALEGQQVDGSQLDRPAPVARRRREVELERSRPEPGRKRRRQRRRGVDDEQVAGHEEARQLAEPGVDERAVRRPVTSIATSARSTPRASGGSARFERRGEGGLAHALPPRARGRGSGRLAASPRSAPAARARESSGAGRSEMSSPGNASWCICVRMSPGSTA